MWKLALGFVIFDAVALFAIYKAGSSVDMSGEKHAGRVALHQLAHGFGEQGGPSLGFAVERIGRSHRGILGVG